MPKDKYYFFFMFLGVTEKKGPASRLHLPPPVRRCLDMGHSQAMYDMEEGFLYPPLVSRPASRPAMDIPPWLPTSPQEEPPAGREDSPETGTPAIPDYPESPDEEYMYDYEGEGDGQVASTSKYKYKRIMCSVFK